MAWRGAEVGGGGPHIHDDIGVCTIHVEGVFVHVNKADIWGGETCIHKKFSRLRRAVIYVYILLKKSIRACGAQ